MQQISLKHLIWMVETARLSPITCATLIDRLGDAKQVYHSDVKHLETLCKLTPSEKNGISKNRSLDLAERILSECKRQNIEIMTLYDAGYPARLRNIFDPPVVLYVKGKLPDFGIIPAFAIVGQRKATPYGTTVTERIAYELSASGMCVVSGMAEGIDSAAHKGALKGRTPTVAVFGTAIDICYPTFNAGLLRDILASGAAISEYPPGAVTVGRATFPMRNRIISGLSLGVMVAEAREKSGSLITAQLALDQGRDVFAIPGSIATETSAGANDLISRGAKLVRNAADILDEYRGIYEFEHMHPSAPPKAEKSTEKVESKPKTLEAVYGTGESDIILNALGEQTLSLAQIMEKTGLTQAEIMSKLTVLELTGKIRQLPGKLFKAN